MRDKRTFKLPPGVMKGASPADAQSRWYDTSLVRWVDGRLQPFGGAIDLGLQTASPIRRILTWADNAGIVRTALLCEQNLYVIENGTLLDISPTVPIAPPASLAPIGGYGDGLYSDDGTYGTPRPASATRLSTGNAYSLANWGQTLVAMTSADGRLLQWDPAHESSPAAAVSGAPINNRCFVVTPERYVMIFGSANDPRHFQWCDQENINSWAVGTLTGTAGEFFVEPSAVISTALSTNSGVLFFTDYSVYLVKYAGAAYVYGFSKVADHATPLSAQCVVEFGNDTMWLSDTGVWIWNGSSVSPMECDLFDWYKTIRNANYARDAAFGFNLVTFPEIFFFFPAGDSQSCDTYIVYNYLDNWWAPGSLKRTAGFGASYNKYPFMAKGQRVYNHEFGQSFPDDENVPYALTGVLNIGQGSSMTVAQAIVDNSDPNETTLYDFYGYHYRVRYDGQEPDEVAMGMASINGYLDPMITARDVQIKVYGSKSNLAWTFGEALLDVRARGSR
jgi:hypothetical protein